MRLISALAVSLLLAPSVLSAQHDNGPPPAIHLDLTPAQWRADFAALREHAIATHPQLQRIIPRRRFDSLSTVVEKRIATGSGAANAMEFQRLLASLGDGHTQLSPFPGGGNLPIRLYAYSDGIFVQAAVPAYKDIVGARVVRIGSMRTDSAMRAISPFVSRDNDYGLMDMGVLQLTRIDVLRAAGIIGAASTVGFTIEKDGATRTVQVAPDDVGGRAWAMVLGAPAGWVDARVAADSPAWLRNPRSPYDVDYFADSNAVYLQLRQIANAQGESFDLVFKRAIALAEEHKARLVIDLRLNGGGSNDLIRPVIRRLIRSSWLSEPGHLYAITGRRTFSAAQNFVTALELNTPVQFVGEPTGARPNTSGDARAFTLPNSGLTALIASVWHQDVPARDTRAFTAPAIAAMLSSSDYRDGRDPALTAALTHTASQPLADRMFERLSAGDSAGAVALHRAYHAEPANAFASSETQINALGYRLLNADRIDAALIAFRLNTMQYPQSANTFDSLGEALVKKGDLTGAVKSYQRALQLSPGLPSAVEALGKLRQAMGGK